jgi:transposase
VIDHAGRLAIQRELPNQDSGYGRLLAVLTSHAVTRVGMERSGNFGWPAAIYLLEQDRNVVEVPAD